MGYQQLELHTAAIYAVDGVRLLTASTCYRGLQERIAEYIEAQAATLLWPDEAARVRSLLSDGELDAGIDLYFGRVGVRWEQEHLCVERVAVPCREAALNSDARR